MSKFLSLKVEIQSYNSAAVTNDPTDGEKISSIVQESDVGAFTRYNPLVIADGVTDHVVALPAATCNYLAIFADQVVSIKINGGAALILRPLGTKKSPVYLTRGDITSLSISNSSGSPANLDIIAAQS